MYAVMKDAIGAANVLVSPCDPDRKDGNDQIQDNWGTYGPGSPVDCDGTSYVMIEGADVGRPSTVLATTRNLESNLNSTWVGADQETTSANVMSLLPMLLVFIGAQRYFVQSVASTGLKG